MRGRGGGVGGTVASLTDPCEERFDRGELLESFLPPPLLHTIIEERVHSQHSPEDQKS